MQISDDGIDFIASFEGFRSQLYNDAAGHCTIGYGHLVHEGPCNGSEAARFRAGLSEAEAAALLREDVTRYEAAVNRLVTVPLAPPQFDALVSFTFNVGIGALERSDLLARLNRGDMEGVPGELARWVYAGGRPLPGLVTRREKEGRLFASATYGEPTQSEPRAQILMRWLTQIDSDATANLAQLDALAACVAMVLDYYERGATVDEVVLEMGLPGEQGYFILDAQLPVVERWGVHLEWAGDITPEQLAGWMGESRPLLALIDYRKLPEAWRYRPDLDANHYVVIVGYENGRLHYLDPLWENERQGRAWLPEETFFEAWGSTRRVRTPFQALVVTEVEELGRGLGDERLIPTLPGDFSLLVQAARRAQTIFDIATGDLWKSAQTDGYPCALSDEFQITLDTISYTARLFASPTGEQRLYYRSEPDVVQHLTLAPAPVESVNELLGLRGTEITPGP